MHYSELKLGLINLLRTLSTPMVKGERNATTHTPYICRMYTYMYAMRTPIRTCEHHTPILT